MACPIEEKFAIDRLEGKTVFEFGCAPGKVSSAISDMGYDVTSIDLYDVDHGGKYNFIKGDLMRASINTKFDNVIAISAIEHCGIESYDFHDGDNSIDSYHFFVSKKLGDLVDRGGRLIVTVPFGSDNTYFVDKNGKNGTRDEIPEPAWGFRTFTVDSIKNLFFNFDLIECEIYEKEGSEYFEASSWNRVGPESYAKYNNKNRAIMCCLFERKEKKMNFGDGISWEHHVDENIESCEKDGRVFYGGNGSFEFADVKDLINTDTPVKERKALDCGCHMGRFVDVVTAYGFDYTGVDQCSKALLYAKSHRPAAKWVYSFLWDMKFDNEFDFAFTNAVLQHNLLHEQEKIVPQVYKALKPGGIFQITESTEPRNTATQRTYEDWIRMVTSFGFEFIKSCHKNPLGFNDRYIFRKPRK